MRSATKGGRVQLRVVNDVEQKGDVFPVHTACHHAKEIPQQKGCTTMQYQDSNVVGLRLDTITRTVRAAAAVAPKAVTRMSLGLVLALEDVATDHCAELLSVKLADGARSLLTTAGLIGKSSACTVASVASSAGGAIGAVVTKASSPEARAARTARIERVPGVRGVKALAQQAGAELKHAWEETGTVYVSVPVDEGREHAVDEFDMFASDIQSMDPVTVPDLVSAR